jgi:hypothetical protein
MNVCMYVCMHVCTYVGVYECMYVCTYVYICMCVCMHACTIFSAEFSYAIIHHAPLILNVNFHHNAISHKSIYNEIWERINFELYLLSLSLYRRKLTDIFKDSFRFSVIKTKRLKLCEQKNGCFL